MKLPAYQTSPSLQSQVISPATSNVRPRGSTKMQSSSSGVPTTPIGVSTDVEPRHRIHPRCSYKLTAASLAPSAPMSYAFSMVRSSASIIRPPMPCRCQSGSTATPSTYPVLSARPRWKSRRWITEAWPTTVSPCHAMACMPPRQCSQSCSVISPWNAMSSISRTRASTTRSTSAVCATCSRNSPGCESSEMFTGGDANGAFRSTAMKCNVMGVGA